MPKPPLEFFAILRAPTSSPVKRLFLGGDLRNEMTELFDAQAEIFTAPDLERVSYEGGYNADENEVFTIEPYTLEDWYAGAIHQPHTIPVFNRKNDPPLVRGILGGRTAHGQTTAFFQTMTVARILGRAFSILLHGDTFNKLTTTGMTLDSKVVAVYESGVLHFRSVSSISGMLNVADALREASDQEINDTLHHKNIATEDAKGILTHANAWVRRRFTLLASSGILDRMTPSTVKKAAKRLGFPITFTRQDGREKLVLPSDNRRLRRTLDLLTEYAYVGELTGTPYVTNSRKKAR